MNRRDFLKGGTAFSALLGGSASELRWDTDGSGLHQPDAPAVYQGNLAVVNARLLTVNTSQPTAQAVLVRNGRITHVGTTGDVKARAEGAEVFDVGGRTVVPGFIDAHTHIEVALSHDVVGGRSRPAAQKHSKIQNALAAKAAATPKGQWVIGRAGFNLEDSLPEKRLPTRQDLDEVSQDHPVIIFSGRHISMLNTRALKEIGMGRGHGEAADGDDDSPGRVRRAHGSCDRSLLLPAGFLRRADEGGAARAREGAVHRREARRPSTPSRSRPTTSAPSRRFSAKGSCRFASGCTTTSRT